ncbi:DHH family phosphoesterase [Pseudofrankia sp. DC12]|uniref:DHH family phosphoesterase n=1 Tax=Pseudofrankia sp. DC12 TaxID=683315 RepID=UPI0005F7D857|nr:DHH family phosphoesterase [Pseudofrankia sp. DC12]
MSPEAASGRPWVWPDAVALLRAALDEGWAVGLFAHVNPDSDTLGSALALGLALRAAGGKVVVSFDAEPFQVPDGLAFLPGQDLLVAPAELPARFDLVVTLDAAAPHMLGTLADRMAGAPRTLVVDHHRSGADFGQVRMVDPDAPSTSSVVLQLLDRLGLELTAHVATALYAGLATDTGSFRQATTSAAAHRAAARLVDAGADPTVIGWSVWGIHRFGYVGLLAEVLGRAGLSQCAGAEEHRLAWTYITDADLTRHGLRLEHVEGVVDVLWGVLEADLAAVAKELPDRGWTVSLRSRGPIDVGAVAMGLGGGGHREKAGFLVSPATDQPSGGQPCAGQAGGGPSEYEARVGQIVASILNQVRRLAAGRGGVGPMGLQTIRVAHLAASPRRS